jgi:hypothetical protein
MNQFTLPYYYFDLPHTSLNCPPTSLNCPWGNYQNCPMILIEIAPAEKKAKATIKIIF